MPTERIAMRRVREMLRLRLDAGLAAREVARRTGVAPSTLREMFQRFRRSGLCSATRRMAGYRRSDGRSQRGVMMAFPKVSDKKICRYSAVSRLLSLESSGLVAPRSAAARRR